MLQHHMNRQLHPQALLLGETGSAMIFVLVIAVIGNIMIGSILMSSRYSSKKSMNRREKISVINIAEAGKEVALAGLRNREINPLAEETVTLFHNHPFGSGAYSVSYLTNAGNDTIAIYSTGKNSTDSIQLEVIATIAPDPAGSGWVKGAVTARVDVGTLGNMEIDGRDYDTTGMFGTPLGTPGTFGVSSGGAVSAGGASMIGGKGVSPQKSTIPGVTIDEYADTTAYPQTPEEVLGLPAGSLDKYKISSYPPAGFSGITYFTQDIDQNYTIEGSGLLIVHNAAGDASLGNYHGHFKGLIIADDVKHFNSGGSSVLGAVFMLGKAFDGNCFGNGKAKIHFSSQALAKAIQSLADARRDVTVVSWREIR